MTFRNVPCSIPALFSPADVLEFRKLTVSTRVAPAIKEYVVDLVRATRDPAAYGLGLAPLLELGASPRATIAPIRAGRGHALLARRDYVTPHDVKTLARDVMRHRIMISYEADAEGLSADDLLGASSTISRCRRAQERQSEPDPTSNGPGTLAAPFLTQSVRRMIQERGIGPGPEVTVGQEVPAVGVPQEAWQVHEQSRQS